MTSSPGPGWYQDPSDPKLVRYWNGAAWTQQVQPWPVLETPVDPTPAPPPASAPTPTPSLSSGLTDLSGRPIEVPPVPATAPDVPDHAHLGFGVPGLPGLTASGQSAASAQANAWASASDGYPAYPASAPYPAAAQTGYSAQPSAPWPPGPARYNAQLPDGYLPGPDRRYVGPLRAIGLGFRKYARFTGRSSRSEFWWWFLFYYVVLIALGAAAGALIYVVVRRQCANQPAGSCSLNSAPLWIMGAVFLFAFLVLLVPTVAVTCRRLQDTNRNGSWIWLYFATIFINIVPGVGPLISFAIDILFLVWLALSGTPGLNRFGLPPDEGNARV